MSRLGPPALGLAWAGFVLAVAAAHRPAPARVRSLAGVAGRPPRARRRIGPGVSADVLGRHRAVIAAAVAAVVAPWPPLLPAIAAGAAWWWPVHRATRRRAQRADEIARAVPDVVDLFLLAVDAGLTVPLAVRAVARYSAQVGGGPLADELRRTVDELDLGRRTADAVDDLAAPGRAGDAVHPLTAALAASERYGAPLADSLVRLADDARRSRRRRAEEAARRLPVTLLFPLVTCTLPAFGLLTVGPLVAGAFRSLRL